MDQFIQFVSNHPFLVGIFAVLIAVFVRNEVKRGGSSVSPQQLVDLVNQKNAVILDVRDKTEYDEGHIVDAINIPHVALQSRLVELDKFKEKPIVVTCKMGQHSNMAGTLLKKSGFQEVMRLRGGVTEWRNQSMPVVKS